MKKEDLKSGMTVELENGLILIVVGDLLIGIDGFMSLNSYDENMTEEEDDNFSIVKVYDKSERFGCGFNQFITREFYKEKLLWNRKDIKLNKID